MKETRKIAVIGAGRVGAATAYTLSLSALAGEIVLLDVDERRARGEALDIAHGLPLYAALEVKSGGYDDIANADLVIITAGVGQKSGETRMELLDRNRAVFASIVPEVVRSAPNAVLLVVTNPVDILTLETLRLSGLPAERVIGTGTVLDTSRLKYLLSRHTGVDPRNIHACVLGEHGDGEFVAWSRASIAGLSLDEYCAACGRCRGPMSEQVNRQFEQEVRRAAYEIIDMKGSTCYAIALAVRRIAEAILRDEHAILTVSTLAQGQYGLRDLCLSLPVVLGARGVERVLEPGLDRAERARLMAVAETHRAELKKDARETVLV